MISSPKSRISICLLRKKSETQDGPCALTQVEGEGRQLERQADAEKVEKLRLRFIEARDEIDAGERVESVAPGMADGHLPE